MQGSEMINTLGGRVFLRLAFLAAVALAGCARLPRNISDNSPIELRPNESLVLASVTMQYAGPFFARASFTFSGVDVRHAFRLDSAVPWTIWPMLEKRPEAGLEEVNGRLYAFAVPAGTYALKAVRIHDSPEWTARPLDTLTFTVFPGEAVYLGNLDVTLCHRMGAGGPYYVSGGRPSIRVRTDRDLPLLQDRWPQLRGLVFRTIAFARADTEARYIELSRSCPDSEQPIGD